MIRMDADKSVVAEFLGRPEVVIYFLVLTLSDTFKQTNLKFNTRSDHFYYSRHSKKSRNNMYNITDKAIEMRIRYHI